MQVMKDTHLENKVDTHTSSLIASFISITCTTNSFGPKPYAHAQNSFFISAANDCADIQCAGTCAGLGSQDV